MSPATLRLVLIVSCAHALVHVYELSLPSVEQLIGNEFGVSAQVTGWLGTCWRLPFGLGAVLAGWLADRHGSKPMLVTYLAGCAATSLLAWWVPGLSWLFVAMFAMGTFASIYHPAGLALISHETAPQHRPLALGYHGIFGSLGIAGAPLLTASVLSLGVNWRHIYAVLVVPGAVMAVAVALLLVEHHRLGRKHEARPTETKKGKRVAATSEAVTPVTEPHGRWTAYFLLIVIARCSASFTQR